MSCSAFYLYGPTHRHRHAEHDLGPFRPTGQRRKLSWLRETVSDSVRVELDAVIEALAPHH